MSIGWPEAILILVVILLVFGVDRISRVAGEMGKGVKAFKEGLSGTDKPEANGEEKTAGDEPEKK